MKTGQKDIHFPDIHKTEEQELAELRKYKARTQEAIKKANKRASNEPKYIMLPNLTKVKESELTEQNKGDLIEFGMEYNKD